jgi:hypothetical protein
MTRTQRARLRAIILALCFSLSTGVASAQAVPLVTFPFSMSGVGVGPAISLSGQSSCAVVLSNAGTGLTLIPQASSDQGATWVTASTIGGGSISTIGSYVGNIGGAGLTTFRFIVSALSSGTVSGQETCSGAIGPAALSGSTVTAIQPTASLLNATVVGAGTAGTPAGGVVSIQGVSGGTVIPVSGTFFQATQPVSCATAATCPTNATLQAGSAIAGKFGIDQTTPGTTNAVVVNAPIPNPTATPPAAISTPAASASSITLLAANATANGFTICNASAAIGYAAKATTATTSAYTLPFPAQGSVPTCYTETGSTMYRGVWSAISASATGNWIVTTW